MLVVLGLVAAFGGCATSEPPPLDPPLDRSPSTASAGLSIAGSAIATPLIRHLAQVFQSRVPGPPLVVEAPLGDAGGLAAFEAGRLTAAVYIAPIGAPVDGVPFARSEVVLAVGPGVQARAVDLDGLLAMIGAERPRWPSGAPLRLWLRSIDDPLQRRWLAAHPAIEPVVEDAIAAGRWPVALREETARSALRASGTLVLTDRGNLSLHGTPSWIVTVDGALPVAVEFRLRVRPQIAPRMAAFVAFITGEEGQSLVADLGFLPAGRR